MGGRSWQSFSREDKLDCCERLTYAQPVDVLVERLDPNISRVFEEQWNETIENHGGTDSDDDTFLADVSEGDSVDSKRLAHQDTRSNRAPDKKNNTSEQRGMDLRLVMNP